MRRSSPISLPTSSTSRAVLPTTARPYRAAIGEHEALAELRRCAGKQFDTRVVDAFEHVLGRRLDLAGCEPLAA